ncbi:MAG: caspase family protein [Planctomycetaceae bacterium]|nr:caspase family protein [Planctomycetaceae bacterium]
MTNKLFFQKLAILPFLFLVIAIVFDAGIGYSAPSRTRSTSANKTKVFNTRGVGTSGSVPLKSAQPNTGTSEPGTRYALLIGVNDYDNDGNAARAKEAKRDFFHLDNLKYCCADMTGLSEALVDSKFTKKENIILLTSIAENNEKKSTIENINRELKNLLCKLKPVDTIFIAFAGHGTVLPAYKGDERSELYLCPMDAEVICNPTTGKFDCRQLISREELEVKLQTCQASTKILVMDACRDRNMATRSIAQPDSLRKATLDEISKIQEFSPKPVEGLFQLFSCGEGQTALENPKLEHGVYSHFMIKGLGGAANSNNDHYITLSELQQYVREMTSEHAGSLDLKQTPKILIKESDGTGDNVILAHCTPTTTPSKEPDILQQQQHKESDKQQQQQQQRDPANSGRFRTK